MSIQWGEVLDIVSKVGGVVAGAVATGVTILILRLKTVFATKQELAEVKIITEENAKAIVKIETVIENLPDAETVNNLRLAVERLNGDIRELSATNAGTKEALDRTTAATTRIEQFLLTRGK